MQGKEQNILSIKQRILYYIDSLGISKRSFYLETGISRGTLESPTGITEDIMAKFLAIHGEMINTDWLIYGKGDMLTRKKEGREADNTVNEPAANYGNDQNIIEQLNKIVSTQEKLIASLERELKNKNNK